MAVEPPEEFQPDNQLTCLSITIMFSPKTVHNKLVGMSLDMRKMGYFRSSEGRYHYLARMPKPHPHRKHTRRFIRWAGFVSAQASQH